MTEVEKNKTCPMSKGTYLCDTNCAWWDPINEKCSVRVIAESLSKMKEMKERGR